MIFSSHTHTNHAYIRAERTRVHEIISIVLITRNRKRGRERGTLFLSIYIRYQGALFSTRGTRELMHGAYGDIRNQSLRRQRRGRRVHLHSDVARPRNDVMYHNTVLNKYERAYL